jgi:alpha-glucuronidase
VEGIDMAIAGEDADEMWLRHSVMADRTKHQTFCVNVDATGEDAVSLRLRSEIVQWLGASLVSDPSRATVILRTLTDHDIAGRGLTFDGAAANEGWHIHIPTSGQPVIIESPSTRGLLYGFYAWLEGTPNAAEEKTVDVTSCPDQPIRMLDQWDQANGSVERGYAGESIFFGRWGSNVHSEFVSFPQRGEYDVFRGDVDRLVAYTRYCASIGLNAICLNNVNVRGYAIRFIQDPWLTRIAQIAHIFESFGLKVFLSVNFAAPRILSGLSTVDPCDPAVQQWWNEMVDHIYERIPGFGGFVVKADSEGEPGPYQYGRTHTDGANMFAHALAPHGGIVIWRAFVYNSHTDWRDRTAQADRARAAWENFHDLDGQFASNAILQVKFGPIDFQTSEPLNPLFFAMKHTNVIMEFEITAEYLGHQIDLNFPLPQWEHMASWPVEEGADAARALSRHALNPRLTGFAAVANVGMDWSWTGNPLAQANFFGYGLFCWNNHVPVSRVSLQWAQLTFPDCDDEHQHTIAHMLDQSNEIYAQYTAPLGVGFMVNRDGHYGPGPDDYEFSRWGTYHFADRDGIGVDRTQKTGTGYAGLYPEDQARQFEDPATTPDDVLLFFHHLPYSWQMKDGRTLLQRIYDDHFDGAARVDDVIRDWKSCASQIDERRREEVSRRLTAQQADAREWRDEICTFLYRFSGIADEHGRKISD